jgi:glycosyltransferase involved in cell wall biosynthesis
MRIGIVINSSWNIYNFRKGLIESFIKSGHEVIAIAPDDGYSEKLRQLGCEFVPLPMEAKGTNPLADLVLTSKLYKAYRESRLDVVLHYTIKPNIYGTFAATLAKVRSINNVTGLGTTFIRNNLTSRIAHWLYKAAFRFPETVFFQNEDDRQLFVEKKLVKADITDILPGSGIDTEHFKPKKRNRYNNGNIFTFLLIARVLYDKGILEYIEAARRLRDSGEQARFRLLGKIDPQKGLGVPEEDIRQWVAEGLIEYLGTTDDVTPIIEEADCVLLPSYREGTPRTLLEAASLGKPIIATDVPGCRETVENGHNGFLCKVKDSEDLAEKMRNIMRMKRHELDRMGRNSRKLAVKKFDHSIVIRKYSERINFTARHHSQRRQII